MNRTEAGNTTVNTSAPKKKLRGAPARTHTFEYTCPTCGFKDKFLSFGSRPDLYCGVCEELAGFKVKMACRLKSKRV